MDNSSKHITYYFLLIFYFSHTILYAQVNNWKFEHFGYKDGLSSNEIVNIIQDSTGYIWIATTEGLNRYNGHSFEKYIHNPNDKYSISSGEITSLKEGINKTIWMGSTVGVLNKYNKQTGRFQQYQITHEGKNWSRVIWEMDFDGDSIIWLAMERGLGKFNIQTGKSEVFLPTKSDLDSNDVQYDVIYSLAINNQNKNQIYVGGRRGLLIFDKQNNHFSQSIIYPEKQLVNDIYQEEDSLVLLAS